MGKQLGRKSERDCKSIASQMKPGWNVYKSGIEYRKKSPHYEWGETVFCALILGQNFTYSKGFVLQIFKLRIKIEWI